MALELYFTPLCWLQSPKMEAVKNIKWTLRKQVKSRLSKISQTSLLRQGQLAAKTVSQIPEFQRARNIGLYMNLPEDELPTEDLIKKCFDTHKGLYLPRVTPLNKFNDTPRFHKQRAILRFLKVDSLTEVNSLIPRGKYQIREPEFKAESGEIRNDLLISNEKLDILFVPGLAFSKDCKRLGHGAGFYDDFIKRYYENYHERPILVGIGLEEQLVSGEWLHTEEHDETLDYVILADKIYKRSN
ncbi:DEKNAAC102800 [Brettanomyces naardenensis]|uniref:5-formyltetrahydrofolate cyclo-ligase n=1 Tax=Brettanomyces naardenensis TaxID=13370 RepID=A0A448YL60_BRENA|nr:DEKNAAC102800 [Brettanomyces naardenensis]